MENDLKNKFEKSIKWTAFITLFNTITQPFYRIFLAILLLPSEYAYIAVITLIVSLAELMNNIGIGEAVIQRDKVSTDELSTLFYFNSFVSILFSILLFFSANKIGIFYELEDLSGIIKILTIITLINGMTSLFKFYLNKNFLFNKTSKIKLIKLISEIVISLTFIILGFGIWGYLWGVLTSHILHGFLLLTATFKFTDFKIDFYFSFNHLNKFLSFGTFVGAKKLITFISQRADEVIVGGALSADILGSYFLAKTILVQVQTLITTSFGQVLLPTFSRMKNDFNKLKNLYLQIFSVISFVGIPLFIFIMISSRHYVPVIFDASWNNTIVVFEWLSIPTLCLLLSAGLTTSLLYSINKTFKVLLIDLILVPIYLTILYLFHSESLTNILIIYSSYIVLKFVVIQIIINKVLNIKFMENIKIIQGTLISSLLTGMALFIFSQLINISHSFLFISIHISLSIIIYLTFTYYLNKNMTLKFLNIIKKTFKSKGV